MMGMSDQRSPLPKWEPAMEYVAMPPASLSTFEVMIPGPATAKKRSSPFQRFFRFGSLIVPAPSPAAPRAWP